MSDLPVYPGLHAGILQICQNLHTGTMINIIIIIVDMLCGEGS